MIEFNQLQQLVAISEHGTISAAAEALHMSQPALSRSVQRMEAELGLSLFERRGNRAELNAVGQAAVLRARELLQTATAYWKGLKTYALQVSTVRLGSCSPAPLGRLLAEASERLSGRGLTSEIKDGAALLEGLEAGAYSLILTDFPVEREGLLCRRYVDETLHLDVPVTHPLAQRELLHLSDLSGQAVLVYREIGVWRELLRALPEVMLIEQQDQEALSALLASSDLPCLSSSLRAAALPLNRRRVSVPIVDERARKSFYLCAAESEKDLMQLFV